MVVMPSRLTRALSLSSVQHPPPPRGGFHPFFFFFFFLLQMLTNHILMCSRFTRPHTFGWHQQVRARGHARGHAQWSAVCRQRPLTTDIHISNITAGVKIKCHISHYTQIRRRKQTFGKDHLTEQKTKNVCMWSGVDANNTRTNRRRCCRMPYAPAQWISNWA